jgi:membrane protein
MLRDLTTSPPLNSTTTSSPHQTGSARWFWGILKQAVIAWQRDNAMRLSAAVAMYTILSLAPLLVISIKITALVLGDEAASRQVEQQLQAFLGPSMAAAVNDMIIHASLARNGVFATIISVAVLLFIASNVFLELRDSLNSIWGIDPQGSGGMWGMIRDRLLSLGMVFVIGFLLLVSQFLTTSLTFLSRYVMGGPGWASVAIDLVVSTVLVTLLFAALFRVLPDAQLTWKEALLGAAVTAVLFKIGQYAQALYFTYAATASAYGAAGTVIVILLWVYYSCWILFFGAELIQAYVQSQGRRIAAAAYARQVDTDDRHWRGGNLLPGPGK